MGLIGIKAMSAEGQSVDWSAGPAYTDIARTERRDQVAKQRRHRARRYVQLMRSSKRISFEMRGFTAYEFKRVSSDSVDRDRDNCQGKGGCTSWRLGKIRAANGRGAMACFWDVGVWGEFGIFGP